ncbi:MAG: 2,3-bisphosphoglycerate-dependent phosphoglycerate mutase [Bacteroidia bacterium]|nr:MAG: 2,3-bisphosphoglycerate-dependent phosphoglycerate mutase [Bacteroidia bacterium]
MSKLVLVRHGQSAWNLENRFTGWVDVPLSENGIKEAEQAAQKLSGLKFDIAFTSALQRAQNTLKIILEKTNQTHIPVFSNQALNERMYGDLQGMNKDEARQKFGDEQVKIWRRSYDIAPPNGESLKDTAARVIPYFEQNILPHIQQNKNVLIVAHGNSLRALVMYLEKMTPEQILNFELGTAVPRVYELDAQLNIQSVQNL